MRRYQHLVSEIQRLQKKIDKEFSFHPPDSLPYSRIQNFSQPPCFLARISEMHPMKSKISNIMCISRVLMKFKNQKSVEIGKRGHRIQTEQASSCRFSSFRQNSSVRNAMDLV